MRRLVFGLPPAVYVIDRRPRRRRVTRDQVVMAASLLFLALMSVFAICKGEW
jgi:hypothetical protein